MLVGLIVFVLGKNVLGGAGEAPAPLAKSREMMLYGIGIASVAVIWGLVQYQSVIRKSGGVSMASIKALPVSLKQWMESGAKP